MEGRESMTKLQVPMRVLQDSLDILHRAGAHEHEGIVLWLGQRGRDHSPVKLAYEPVHAADIDYFHIPPEGMRALMKQLDEHDFSILAQVHSHPGAAFHSEADDKWAIVRHRGALSLVLPHFARNVRPASFLQQVAVFSLTSADEWVQVSSRSISDWLEVSP